MFTFIQVIKVGMNQAKYISTSVSSQFQSLTSMKRGELVLPILGISRLSHSILYRFTKKYDYFINVKISIIQYVHLAYIWRK